MAVGHRESSSLAGVGSVPVVGDEGLAGMGRHLEYVAFARRSSDLDLADLLADGEERVNESVQFALRLALGWLDHETARDGPAHGGSVESVVHEALGDVHDFDAGRVSELATVEDEFVGAEAGDAAVEDFEAAGNGEPGHHVVGVEDGDLGRLGESGAAHHADVGPADGEDGRGSVGSGRNGAAGAADVGEERVSGKEGDEVLTNADGSHAGSTAAVRDGEGLVKVQMGDVGPVFSRATESNLRVHVGSIEVDLTPGLVDEGADVGDGFLEDSVSGWVSDHDGGQILAVLVDLGLDVLPPHVAVLVALEWEDLHARHLSGGGIGAVGGGRDETELAVSLSSTLEVAADGEKTGVFTLSAGVGLEGDVVVAGDVAEPVRELSDELSVALCLVEGYEWMNASELWLGECHEGGGGIELHGARAERDHGVCEGEIAVLESLGVAHELGLAADHVEVGVVEVGGGARESVAVVKRTADGSDARVDVLDALLATAEDAEEGSQLDGTHRLVQTHTHRAILEVAKVGLGGGGGGLDVHEVFGKDFEGVKVFVVHELMSGVLNLGGEIGSGGVNVVGDAFETGGSVIHGVHGGHVGEECLGGADVGCGLVSSDVLLPGL